MDNRVDDAIKEFTQALDRRRLSAEAIANVGTLVLQCGLPEDAKRLLKLAITGLERPSWVVHFLLGRAHADLGEFADAEQELWAAISLNSTEPRLYAAHFPAFEQHTARRARSLLAEARRRVESVRADTEFLDEFGQRLQRVLEDYREQVKGLNKSPIPGSAMIAKSFELIRRAVDGLRVAVSSIDKLLRDPEARDASSSPMAAANWLENLAGEPSVAAEARRLLDLARHLQPASKLRELKSLLSLTSARERVIVFTDFRSTARCVADVVGGIPHRVLPIHHATPLRDVG